MTNDLWQRGCERLATELPEQQFNTWIRPLPPAEVSEVDGGIVVGLRVPNRFKLDWIRTQYAARLEEVLTELADQPVRLELSLQPRGSSAAPAARASTAQVTTSSTARTAMAGSAHAGTATEAAAGASNRAGLTRRPSAAISAAIALPPALANRVRQQHQHSQMQETRPVQLSLEDEDGSVATVVEPPAVQPLAAPSVVTPSRTAPAVAPATNRGRLNPLLTFENLVPGRSNQMARTAAMHVAGAPSQMYNPLYIYGGVGLGKTHLIHAVGNALVKDRPDAKVLYLHSEQFISDVVRNYQRKTFDELKNKYHSLDLLLIDDVQFFAGKERTQEEFFTAFETLLAKRAHIIMTSDTYPKGLVDIDERLTSRFDAGLTVAVEPPELEMRVAILTRKAELEHARMPEDVAFFIAKNVRANVRELEGALRKVMAYSRFSHKDININLARDALKDLLSIQNKQISVENIQKTVADFYKIKIADMYSKKRPTNIARPRQIAMYLAKEMTQKSLPQIGELFGGRDHTTVLYAVRKIAAERQKLPELNQQLHVLEQTLKG
ncbi:MAG: chromosomal replication initiator protein DnaA [Pseudomonadota bacterium]|jgi:chromosomal replication initiator protein